MKILITDDHKIVRDGLKEILKQVPDIETITEANDGSEALALCHSNNFDLILLDISLPDMTGLEVLQTLIRKKPAQKVLILSMHPQEQYALRALKLGASGYLTKSTAAEELIIAVMRINAGGKYISSSLAENIARHSKADNVEIIFYRQKSDVILEIKDDGIGISMVDRKSPKSLGLLNMSERARDIGGKFVIESRKKKGTRICLTVPDILFEE